MDNVVVDVMLLRGRKYNQFLIEQCPYCGECHYHGAGRSDEDPSAYQGHRLSHCVKSDAEGRSRGYILRWKAAKTVAPKDGVEMNDDPISDLFDILRRALGKLVLDVQYQVLARPSRRPPVFSSPDWARRPIQVQLADARAELEAAELEAAMPRSEAPPPRDHLTAAAVFVLVAVHLRNERKWGKKGE